MSDQLISLAANPGSIPSLNGTRLSAMLFVSWRSEYEGNQHVTRRDAAAHPSWRIPFTQKLSTRVAVEIGEMAHRETRTAIHPPRRSMKCSPRPKY
ncbi:hypothetical protein VTJ04DRAFT_2143 [Mycothermus thermophilus]|uniref:uncharacterized protein n=1 Tax=Humicola insolens TaxID=85995 RepID=UPI0037435D14